MYQLLVNPTKAMNFCKGGPTSSHDLFGLNSGRLKKQLLPS